MVHTEKEEATEQQTHAVPTQLGATPPRSPPQQQQPGMFHRSPKSPRTRAADAALQQMEALSAQPEVPDLVTETEASLRQLHAELYEGSERGNTPLTVDEGVALRGATAAETKPKKHDDCSTPVAEMVSYMTIADELGVTTHAAHLTDAGSTATVTLPTSLTRATHALSSAAGSSAPEKTSLSKRSGEANRRRSFVLSEPVSSPLVRAMHALSMAEPTPPPCASHLGRRTSSSTADSFSVAAGDTKPLSTEPTTGAITGARTQADRSERARSPAENPAAAAAAALVAARLSSRLSERRPQQLPTPSSGNKSGSSPLDGGLSLGLSASSLMDTTAGASDDVSLSLGACESLAALVAEATAAGGSIGEQDADSTLADLSLGAYVKLPAEEDAPMLHAVLRDTVAGVVALEQEEEGSPMSESEEAEQERTVVSAEATVEAAAATVAMQRQLQSVEAVVSKLCAAATAAAATTELTAEDGLKETREHLTEVWQLSARLQELVGAPRIDQWERALSNSGVGGGDDDGVGDGDDDDGGGGGGTMLWTLLEVARLSRRLTATAPEGGAASLTADTVPP
jgi:hypothetical protein